VGLRQSTISRYYGQVDQRSESFSINTDSAVH
jgi:hypothetical protein